MLQTQSDTFAKLYALSLLYAEFKNKTTIRKTNNKSINLLIKTYVCMTPIKHTNKQTNAGAGYAISWIVWNLEKEEHHYKETQPHIIMSSTSDEKMYRELVRHDGLVIRSAQDEAQSCACMLELQ